MPRNAGGLFVIDILPAPTTHRFQGWGRTKLLNSRKTGGSVAYFRVLPLVAAELI
jgi:hypothetical protein